MEKPAEKNVQDIEAALLPEWQRSLKNVGEL